MNNRKHTKQTKQTIQSILTKPINLTITLAIGGLILLAILNFLILNNFSSAGIQPQIPSVNSLKIVKSCADNGGLCIPASKCNNKKMYNLGKLSCVGSLTCCSEFPPPTPTPTPIPTPTPNPGKTIFVTSTSYNGNLGGLEGADAICQERAIAGGLSGIYKAWLSTNTISASSRLTHSDNPYVRVDGVVVADNWNDLTDGTLSNNIIITELNSFHGNEVWTGTNERGEIHNPGASKCSDWSAVSNDSPLGSTGHSGYTTYNWTWGSSRNCASYYPLYCIEQ